MEKKEAIEVKGTVVEALPNAMFKVKLENEHEVLAQFNHIFNEKRGLKHWQWKYQNNPWGNGFLTIAWHN